MFRGLAGPGPLDPLSKGMINRYISIYLYIYISLYIDIRKRRGLDLCPPNKKRGLAEVSAFHSNLSVGLSNPILGRDDLAL